MLPPLGSDGWMTHTGITTVLSVFWDATVHGWGARQCVVDGGGRRPAHNTPEEVLRAKPSGFRRSGPPWQQVPRMAKLEGLMRRHRGTGERRRVARDWEQAPESAPH